MFEDVDLGLLVGIDVPVWGTPPPARGYRPWDLFELIRRVQLLERVSPNKAAGGSVNRNRLAVAEVVPVVEGRQESTIGDKRVGRAHGILEGGVRHELVAAVGAASIKLGVGIAALGRTAEADTIANALSREDPHKVATVFAEHVLCGSCRPIIGEHTSCKQQGTHQNGRTLLHRTKPALEYRSAVGTSPGLGSGAGMVCWLYSQG